MSAFGGGKIPYEGLVLYLDSMNDESYISGSQTWYDLSGYGNNFIMSGSVAVQYDGQGFYGFSLNTWWNIDHDCNYINYFPLGDTDRTLITVAKTPASFASYDHIFIYGGASSGKAFSSATYTGGKQINHTWSGAMSGSTILEANTKYCFAHTYTSLTGSFWFNTISNPAGVGVGKTAPYTLNTTLTGDSANARVGLRIYNPFEPWEGTIYIVMLYNRVLTTEEMDEIYLSIRSRFGLK